MRAKSLTVEIEQAMAVAIFLIAHGLERGCGLGVILAHAFSQIRINATVFLLCLNGDGENFLHGQVFERLWHN